MSEPKNPPDKPAPPSAEPSIRVEITWTPGAQDALKSLQERGLISSSATEKRRWNAALKLAVRECVARVQPRGDAAIWAQTHRDTPWSLDASFVCDEEMRELNSRFRSKDRATDVLSFSQAESAPLSPDLADLQATDTNAIAEENADESAEEDAEEIQFEWPSAFGVAAEATLGDLVIAVETAQRQATERAHDGQTETLFLSIHGVLHLLGYDHQTSAQRIAMWREQEALFERLRSK